MSKAFTAEGDLAASLKEEPPSRLRRLWARARGRLYRPSKTTTLREAVEDLIEEAAASDAGSPPLEREFLANIVRLREKHVGDCMVPRAKIVAIDADSPLSELVDLMTTHAHSRIPVFRETLDDALGMAHIKDVMARLAKGQSSRLSELLRPLLFVVPSMPVAKLLMHMRQTRQHMALVVDEFGGVDGLVTIEDLVEEIVGEIDDEHDDPAPPQVIARADGSLLIDARIDIEAFEEKAGSLLSEDEREGIDTLAGYVFHLAGHVPQIGETVAGPRGISFDVLEASDNRILRVRVRGAVKKVGS